MGNDFFNGPSADAGLGRMRWGRRGRKREHFKGFAVLFIGDASYPIQKNIIYSKYMLYMINYVNSGVKW